MTKVNVNIIVMLLLIVNLSQAQQQWNWPEDSAQARRRASIYPDMMKSGDFEQAREHLDWLLTNAPDLNVSIYINGVKLYDSLSNHTEDPTTKHQLHQRLLDLYDTRVQYFGKKASVSKRKAYAAYRLLKNRPDQLLHAITILDSAFIHNSPNIHEGLFMAYTDLLRRSRKHQQIADDQEVLVRFDQMLGYFEKNESSTEGTETKLFALLQKTIDFDCGVVRDWLVPKLEHQPVDTLLARRIVQMSYQYECTEEQYFVSVMERLLAEAPSYALYKVLGGKYEKQGNFGEAISNYEQALTLTSDPEDLFQVNMRIARLHQRQGRLATARSRALQSLKHKPGETSPYELIGDLWLGSFENCKKGQSRVKDRAVYLAAYKYYEKAGNKEKMNLAAQQFPSIAEIFDELMKEGETLEISCWSKEQVTLKRRQNLNN